ncbi:MAG: APC family permease [Clostridiales bacterium]|nr:APC family permease [Clostridiales bacterium]
MAELENMEGLKKQKVGVLGIVGIIYTMCCAGAYGVEEMISLSGPGMTVLALCVLPFIWAYPQAIACAELGSAIPEEGGCYVWMQRAFGEFWGFQMGYWMIIINYLFVPTMIVLAGNYVGTPLGWSTAGIFAFKMALIAIFGYVNWRGVKDVSVVSTAMSIIIFIAFLGIIAIGLTHWQYNPIEPFVADEDAVLMSAGYAFVIGMWMYGGYSMIGNVAGELENPQVIPKALMIAMPLIMCTYIPSVVAGVAAVGRWEEWGTDGVSWVDVGNAAAPVFGVIFVGIAVIGHISIFNSYLGTTSRTIFVMSMDKLAPKVFSRCSKKTGVPDVALLSIIIACIIFSTFDFAVIVMLTVEASFLMVGGIMLSVLVLRNKEPYAGRPFKSGMPNWLFNAMCVMVLVICVVFMYLNGTDYFLFGTAIVFFGPLLYWLLKKSYQSKKGAKAMNPGDKKKISFLFFLVAVLCAVGYLFLPWYDDPEWFEEVYGIPGILQMYFNGIGIIAIVSAILGAIFYAVHKKEAV